MNPHAACDVRFARIEAELRSLRGERVGLDPELPAREVAAAIGWKYRTLTTRWNRAEERLRWRLDDLLHRAPGGHLYARRSDVEKWRHALLEDGDVSPRRRARRFPKTPVLVGERPSRGRAINTKAAAAATTTA